MLQALIVLNAIYRKQAAYVIRRVTHPMIKGLMKISTFEIEAGDTDGLVKIIVGIAEALVHKNEKSRNRVNLSARVSR